MQTQLTLFGQCEDSPPDLKALRSGTFIDNMSLPIHRWFRFSAGFSAQWVERVLDDWGIAPGQLVLDPFAGSGTVPVVCDTVGVRSLGVEAHPVIYRICHAKSLWQTPVEGFIRFSENLLKKARTQKSKVEEYPQLIRRSFDDESLQILDALKRAWLSEHDQTDESELVWLAITAILRPASKAGTAQWQYILPNKTKKKVLAPLHAFQHQIEMMKSDLLWMQAGRKESKARVINGDARNLANLLDEKVDAVITSPPYANNYDYADSLRFEMTFWGDVKGWGDIHELVRKRLIVSSSQHSSRERLKADEILADPVVSDIRDELAQVVKKLSVVRMNHGGKKHYHTMVAGYCRDIGLVLRQLRAVCKTGSRMCWVIGDSAPYGVYCPIEKWIAQMALGAGFKNHYFEKLRDRNIKWKNRKHRVPLKEGLLWIEG